MVHLNVTEVQIFAREDNRLDRTLKVIGIILSTVLFINSFFGYWISLNRDDFPTGNWGTFTFVVVVFYLITTGISFTGFLAIIYQWERVLLGASVTCGTLFLVGLCNNGLKANFFAFVLFVLNALFFALLYLHLAMIEQCRVRGHHYTCRGCCIRHEKVQFVDGKLFAGKPTLVGIFGTTPGVEGPQGSLNETHIPFPNDAALSSSSGGTSKPQFTAIPEPATLQSQQSTLSKSGDSTDLQRSLSAQSHRRQPSQTVTTHLDASSQLQM